MLIPAQLRIAAIAALAIVVVTGTVAMRWQIDGLKADLATERASHASDRAAWATASAQAAEAQRQIETARQRAHDGVVDAARTENAALARRAADLDDAARRMREYIVTTVTARSGEAGSDPHAPAGSSAAAGPGMVFADLYRGVDEEAVSLARAYDAARIAGGACERTYDSLTTP